MSITKGVNRSWRSARGALIVALLGCAISGVSAEVPELPRVLPVPPTGRMPIASANRPGTEYSDLRKAGYVEEEQYMFGAAPAITAEGKALFDVPYTTRILVRFPKDPKRFNGTVVIEPFTWFGERSASWILTRDYLLRKGYGWVGYTVSINKPAFDPKMTAEPAFIPDAEPHNLNLDWMRWYDYKRYAPLGFYYDPARFRRGGHADEYVPQAQGVAAQLARLLKTGAPDGPLHGLKVDRVYVNSFAVTAQLWMDYLDQGRHQQWRMPDGKPLIDAYMTGRYPFGQGGGGFPRVPRQLPGDAPYVNVFTESELIFDAANSIPAAADSDNPRFRFYQVLGMPHLRTPDLGTDEVEDFAEDVGKQDDPRCRHLYDEPVEVIVSALLDNMDRWVREDKVMARAPRVVIEGKGAAHDPATGNKIGGIRPPWIAVPSASYMTDAETGCGLTYDTKIPYVPAKLKALYGSYAAYAKRFRAAVATSVREGYILPEDAGRVTPVATPADFVTASTR